MKEFLLSHRYKREVGIKKVAHGKVTNYIRSPNEILRLRMLMLYYCTMGIHSKNKLINNELTLEI